MQPSINGVISSS